MKMKKMLALLLVLVGVVSCEKDDSAEIVVTSDYFPLTVGNQWTYELMGTLAVKQSYTLDSQEYFGMGSLINDSIYVSDFYRVDGNKVYVRQNSLNNDEEMKFNLAAKVGQTWSYGEGKVKLTSRDAIITVGETEIDSCLEFSFYNEDIADYDFEIWLAPNIGMIQKTCQECYGTSYNKIKLLDANIDN